MQEKIPLGRAIGKQRRCSESDHQGYVGALYRNGPEKETETGAIGRALAMCGYGTLQAPEFDEQDRLADTPVVKNAN